MARTRRQFMHDAARGVAAGAIAVVTWMLVDRDPNTHSEAPCINRGVCRSCALAKECQLPAALSMRKAITKGQS